MEWDAFQSVIPDVIHKPDAQINAIWQREGGSERGRRSADGWDGGWGERLMTKNETRQRTEEREDAESGWPLRESTEDVFCLAFGWKFEDHCDYV